MSDATIVELDTDLPIWDRFFIPTPLVVIGSREPDGRYDLAPKTMVTQLGWSNLFGFVCTPTHSTYTNIAESRCFTVSFPTRDQIVAASLTASPREGNLKTVIDRIGKRAAVSQEGYLLDGAQLMLECELDRIIDGFGDNSLIVGKIARAAANDGAVRFSDTDDNDIILRAPLLVYVSPGRYSVIEETWSFPYPVGFTR